MDIVPTMKAALALVVALVIMGCTGGGPEVVRLTSGPWKEAFPSFTPDGRVLYASEEVGNYDLWSMDIDGTGKRRLTEDEGYEVLPAPTPKGIVYESGTGVWLLRDGGMMPILTGGWYSDPRPSPDGRLIAYVNTTGEQELWLWDLGGGEGKPLLGGPPKLKKDPTWSPDGREIAFAGMEAGTWDIYVIRLGGGAPIQLTQGSEEADRPVYTPDGKGIVYRRQGNRTELWQMGARGEDPRPFVLGTDSMMTSAFSPDGRSFAFDARKEGNLDIWLLRNPSGDWRKVVVDLALQPP